MSPLSNPILNLGFLLVLAATGLLAFEFGKPRSKRYGYTNPNLGVLSVVIFIGLLLMGIGIGMML